jgi:choline dehydrogenase
MRDGWGIEREEFDWGFTAEPDEHGEEKPVRRKRVLGGTSWLTRFTPRGAPPDYDEWVALGNDGWSFDEILPYFMRLEDDREYGHEPWHGDSGPIPSTRYPELAYAPITEATLDAVQRSGFPWVDDHNRPGAVGVGRMPMNTRDGIRVTTADAYLPLGGTPANLTIRAEALVDRVVFDGSRATGVRLADGSVVEAGWVVLCAGTFGSPPILLRSGIGPANDLRALDVEVRVDAPVGTNLADHPQVAVDFPYAGPSPDGPVLHAIATFRSEGTASDQPPDLMFWIADPEGDPPEAGIAVVLLKPESRGRVRLRSADPTAAPSIALPSLDEERDVERLAEGYRRAVDIVADLAATRTDVGALPAPPSSRAELAALIRAQRFSVPHVVGTCAMGTVVDTDGRVHGTEALSVFDASIMPTVPSGFTHVPTIMIAERLSERLSRAL